MASRTVTFAAPAGVEAVKNLDQSNRPPGMDIGFYCGVLEIER
jgi:hypothetical protein